MKKEIPVLTAEVEKTYAEIWNPRDVVFKDILLQRPKYVGQAAVLGWAGPFLGKAIGVDGKSLGMEGRNPGCASTLPLT